MPCLAHTEYYAYLWLRCNHLAMRLWPGRHVFVQLGSYNARTLFHARVTVWGRGRPFCIYGSDVDTDIAALIDLRRRLTLAVNAVRRNARVNRIRVARRG
ncbi:hypothetical protein DBV05_g9963 [Lasiodiplodia theobromae]|uniref:Uncharacterized protein n=1 Tax=Lasiodiplodia theobromae TaxID=45133 RepID=A0A5N5D123_9PEZI|nr:hypothetical protein DBV05_g9963 [Lasiodiplodia theobromae]